MKLLDAPINEGVSPEQCAHEVLDVVPLIMRIIRMELRANRSCDLSVPQFRALNFMNRQPGISLSELAEHIGLTLPSMSKMVDGLVARHLVLRTEDPVDRRRIVLQVTDEGAALVQLALAGTQASLARRLAGLAPEQRAGLTAALAALRPLFGTEAEPDDRHFSQPDNIE